MTFEEFATEDGSPVLINPEHVAAVEAHCDHPARLSLITLAVSSAIAVRATLKEVQRRMDASFRFPC